MPCHDAADARYRAGGTCLIAHALCLALVWAAGGCRSEPAPTGGHAGKGLTVPASLEHVDPPLPATATHGEVVYVPIYSSIYSHNSERWIELTATLSFRNTDATREVFIRSAKYYDTDGKLLEDRAEKPIRLAPMQTVSMVVERKDTRGGAGANFLVEWVAEPNIHPPVIEAVMVSVSLSNALAFTSPGRTVEAIAP